MDDAKLRGEAVRWIRRNIVIAFPADEERAEELAKQLDKIATEHHIAIEEVIEWIHARREAITSAAFRSHAVELGSGTTPMLFEHGKYPD